MNFFTGKLIGDAGALRFDEGTGALPIPDWANPQLRPHLGKEVVMGVRPESLADQRHARFKTDGNALQMRVTLVQPLGDKMDVYLATDQHPKAIAQVDAHTPVKAGDTLHVCFDMNRVHFFEPGEVGVKLAHNERLSPLGAPL
jgi:multiple sugar transport system ATP-binding protein